MKKLFLFWYSHKEGNGNFGDELNPYIIGKLTDETIVQVEGGTIINKRITILKNIISQILHREISIKQAFKSTYFQVLSKPVIIAIGSVIDRYRMSNCIVWGTGMMFPDREIRPAKFLAVRGKITQERLRKLNYKAPEVLGDPALLLPLVYTPKPLSRKYKLGIIPHFRHLEQVKELVSENNDYLLINILDPVEKIIDEINSCELTLSTSLHGIIASHSYGIPSIWVDITGELLAGGSLKFHDYFSSVDIPAYEVKSTPDEKSIEELYQKFKKGNLEDVVTFPNPDLILKIQKELLQIAPFTLKSEFEV